MPETTIPAPPPPDGEQNPQPKSFKDILTTAKEAGAAQREQSERRAKAKEKIKAAWTKTKEVSRATTDTVKGLTSKDVRGELKGLIKDKIAGSGDALINTYDSIVDKADLAKDAAVTKAREKAAGLANLAKDTLVTKPTEKVKSMGKDIANYYIDKGKNVVDGLKARQADSDATYFKKKALKYDSKVARYNAKMEKISAKAHAANEAGRSTKLDRLNRKGEKMEAKAQSNYTRVEKYKSLAHQSRESANQFRTNIAGRK